jgi:hypothetical protein
MHNFPFLECMAELVLHHLEIQFCASVRAGSREAKLGWKFTCRVNGPLSHGLFNFSATVTFPLPLNKLHQGMAVQSQFLLDRKINQAWLTERGSPSLDDIFLTAIDYFR